MKPEETKYHANPAIEFNLQGDIRLRTDIPEEGEWFHEFSTDFPPMEHVEFPLHRRTLRRGTLVVVIPVGNRDIAHKYRTYVQVKA